MASDLARRWLLGMVVAIAGCANAVFSAPPAETGLAERSDGPWLRIRPRYYRWHVEPGVPWLETNTRHATLDWRVPQAQAALVLVDVWDRHYLADTEARAETIIRERFGPLLAACRQSGLRIIHAPSPPQAMSHPNWVHYASDKAASGRRSSWPPAEFRGKTGPYQAYRRPAEPREPELRELRAGLKIHPLVQPQGDEPVVATGEELHRYCEQERVLFLFYAGFNANACILSRDYGTLEMSRRGYEVILLRDCTTAMESHTTQSVLGQTEGAVLLLEMFGQYSLTSPELITALNDRGQARLAP